MKILDKLYSWYGRKVVITVGVTVGLLIVIGFWLTGTNSVSEESLTEELTTVVSVSAIKDIASKQEFSVVGTVEAVSEARLQTESGGQVTNVLAKIGDTVTAGSILVILDNANERAALLQAEGAYEAAQASAASSLVGTREAEIRLNEAKNNLAISNTEAYSTIQSILINTLDINFYANPNSSYPSLRIKTQGDNVFLREERLDFQKVLPVLQNFRADVTDLTTLKDNANYATTQLTRVLAITDIFLSVVNSYQNDDDYIDTEKARINAELNVARSSLVNALKNLEQNTLALETAEEGLEKAKIGAAGGTVSISEAQLKQALGAYRAAQANYEKTIVRTPISGVVNALYLKAGDYVSPATPAAIVANNNGLEISTAISEEEAANIVVGDIVYLDKTATGTVSAIGGAIDPTTGKVALKISVNEDSKISNGSTVRISFSPSKALPVDSVIRVPLSAIKMTGSGPVIFTVNDKLELVASAVTLGPVSGNDVVISSGVTLDTEIVVDARGLKAGQVVTVSEK